MIVLCGANLLHTMVLLVYRLVASTILKAAYGYSTLPKDDPLIALLERAATMSGEAGSPGATSIDLFPMCKLINYI